ncbi:MAG: hypothetical protein KDN22_18305 [Verrucomicrobiae bacterium]|nr:hypothetical protein [Verrucomicrobiae bacterium]
MKSATNRNGREELREWLGLDYRDFDLRPNNRDAVSRKDILKLACLFARGDRSGAKIIDDETVTLTESDLYLEALAAAALKTLSARAQSGNEDAQRLFFDLVCEAVGDFEQLGFRDLPTFKQRARKRAEIPAMVSRVKGHGAKSKNLLDTLEQGVDCPRAGAMAFTPIPWLVDQLFMAMSGIRRTATMFTGLVQDDFVLEVVNLKPLDSDSVDPWIDCSWAWLLRSTKYTHNDTLQKRSAEEDHLARSKLFRTPPLNEKPGALFKRFRAAWRDLAKCHDSRQSNSSK